MQQAPAGGTPARQARAGVASDDAKPTSGGHVDTSRQLDLIPGGKSISSQEERHGPTGGVSFKRPDPRELFVWGSSRRSPLWAKAMGWRSERCCTSMTGGHSRRGPDNALVLEDPDRYVGRQHAGISFHDGAFFLTDTSTNGTFVNSAAKRLPEGQEVELHDW